MRACWIQTYSGGRFEPLNPDPMGIRIEDIAHALSCMCRFTGHTREFYSVAQHSVLASLAIMPMWQAALPEEPLFYFTRAALLHDASEAYLVDVPAPIKPRILGYAEIEEKVMAAVAQKFCIADRFFSHPLVKQVDRVMLATEKRDLMKPRDDWGELPEPLTQTIEPWTPREAEAHFLTRWKEIN